RSRPKTSGPGSRTWAGGGGARALSAAAKTLTGRPARGLTGRGPKKNPGAPATAANPGPAASPARSTGRFTVPPAAAAPAPPPAPAPAANNTPGAPPSGGDLLAKLNRVREICNSLLGTVGESVVNKHYQKARTELEKGGGFEAI